LHASAQKNIKKQVPVHLAKGLDFTLSIPQAYKLSVATEGLRRLRFLCKSPDGRLFATDMYDLSDNKKGKIYILENWNNETKKFEKTTTFLEGLHNPNQIAFYTYQGFSFIYIAETHQLSFYPYFAGDNKPTGKQTVIAKFPDYGLSYKYGGWHLTRSIAFNNNKLYVSVGSSCNTCIEKEEIRATIMEMNIDGSNATYFAKGVRNSVDLNWVNNKLYATNMGCDLLPDGKPDDTFLEVKKGKHYGWPYYYQYNLKMYGIDSLLPIARKLKVAPTAGIGGFKAHSAPLGFDYFKNFNDAQLKNSFLVCLHGSTTISRKAGYSIVKWIKGKQYENVIDGFLQGSTEKERFGRPCDILMNDANSFFFTDDFNGVLYFVYK
jgi:glucose/arabinose dehydrogenase